MPTIRSYFYRSLSLVVKIGLAILVCPIVFFVVGWILPPPIADGILVQVLDNLGLIGFVVLLLVIAFLFLKLYKVNKKEVSFTQELIKMSPAVIVWLATAFLGVSYLGKFFDNTDCQNYNYNEKLNGGVKTINGKKYTINICGSGVSNGHFSGSGMDTVQLSVTDEQGQLVAKRHYKVFWDGQPGHAPLTIGKDSITYQDDETQTNHTVDMPPTFIDWIRARLPF